MSWYLGWLALQRDVLSRQPHQIHQSQHHLSRSSLAAAAIAGTITRAVDARAFVYSAMTETNLNGNYLASGAIDSWIETEDWVLRSGYPPKSLVRDVSGLLAAVDWVLVFSTKGLVHYPHPLGSIYLHRLDCFRCLHLCSSVAVTHMVFAARALESSASLVDSSCCCSCG